MQFTPDLTLALYFGMSKFDNVKPNEKNKTKKFLAIDQAKKDCDDLKACLEHYNIRNPNDIYLLDNDPSKDEYDEKIVEITGRIKECEKAGTKILIVTLYAGHGMLKDGMQTLLTNEFDEKKGFYKMILAETWARDWARYTNTYVICFFACCRQLYSDKRYVNSQEAVNQKKKPTPDQEIIKKNSLEEAKRKNFLADSKRSSHSTQGIFALVNEN